MGSGGSGRTGFKTRGRFHNMIGRNQHGVEPLVEGCGWSAPFLIFSLEPKGRGEGEGRGGGRRGQGRVSHVRTTSQFSRQSETATIYVLPT